MNQGVARPEGFAKGVARRRATPVLRQDVPPKRQGSFLERQPGQIGEIFPETFADIRPAVI